MEFLVAGLGAFCFLMLASVEYERAQRDWTAYEKLRQRREDYARQPETRRNPNAERFLAASAEVMLQALTRSS